MRKLRPVLSRSTPAMWCSNPPPVLARITLILPSPKLPTSSEPASVPHSAGAIAMPHGAFRLWCEAIRATNTPSGVYSSTIPRPTR